MTSVRASFTSRDFDRHLGLVELHAGDHIDDLDPLLAVHDSHGERAVRSNSAPRPRHVDVVVSVVGPRRGRNVRHHDNHESREVQLRSRQLNLASQPGREILRSIDNDVGVPALADPNRLQRNLQDDAFPTITRNVQTHLVETRRGPFELKTAIILQLRPDSARSVARIVEHRHRVAFVQQLDLPILAGLDPDDATGEPSRASNHETQIAALLRLGQLQRDRLCRTAFVVHGDAVSALPQTLEDEATTRIGSRVDGATVPPGLRHRVQPNGHGDHDLSGHAIEHVPAED